MAILNKSDLAAEVGQQSGLGNGEATLAVEKVFELIAGRLAAGVAIGRAAAASRSAAGVGR